MKPLVSIPVPCHEDWNKMTPAAQGVYCDSCKKVVRDFSDQSDEEINTYLLERRGEKVCGRFRVDQIIPNVKLKFSFESIPNFLSPIKKFAFAVLLVFGASLFNITSVKGENVISFHLEMNAIPPPKINYSVPFKFKKTEMDSVMSSYDSLLVLLKPIPYSEVEDFEIAQLPPLPDSLYPYTYNWDFTFTNPNPVCSIFFKECIFNMGCVSIPQGENAPFGPAFDPEIEDQSTIPLPKTRYEPSTLTEETKKENEENDKKRDFPKVKRNDDLIEDSDFPSLRKEKK